MFLLCPGSPHCEDAIRHVDPDDPAVPDIATKHAVQRCKNLIDGRAHDGTSKEKRKTTHEHAQIGRHRCAQRNHSTESAYFPALDPRGLQLQFVEKRFRDECQLRSRIEPEMQGDSVGARESHDWETHPEHVTIRLRSRARGIAKTERVFRVIHLQVQLANYVEADDTIWSWEINEGTALTLPVLVTISSVSGTSGTTLRLFATSEESIVMLDPVSSQKL